MTGVLIKLPFDKTGKAQTNKVSSEPHTLVNRTIRTVVPEYGAFFVESLVVVDATTSLPLTPGVQYQAAEMYPVLTRKYGKAIYAAIVITDKTVSNNVIVTYQALGGEYSYSVPVIAAKYAQVAQESAPLDFDDIIDKPAGYPVAPHKHNGLDVYGMEYLTKLLGSIKAAIATGDKMSHTDVYNFIDQAIGNAADDASTVVDASMADHVNPANNPHAQYAKVSDVNATITAVRTPTNISPAPASSGVLPTTALQASPYYTYYGIAQGVAQFQAAQTVDFANPTFDVTLTGANTSYQPPSIFHPSSTYYWRVRYQDSEGVWSAWSQITTFSTAAVAVAAPNIVSPTAGADTNTESPTLLSSAFSVIGGVDTHAASDWQVWTGPNGTGVLAYSSAADTANKTSITVPLKTLAQNTHYFARVRYKGATYGYSDWSSDLLFNSVWPLRPTVIGQTFGGGYYAGDIVIGSATYAIIVAPKASGEKSQPLLASTASTANTSAVDSVANTNALYGTSATGAAAWAKTLNIGGFTDWCIPSTNVMSLIWTNLRGSGTATPTNFKTGGTDAFVASYYWTSTAYNWVDAYTDPSTPKYANVNHVDCSYSASGWYGTSDGAGPPASCPKGTVSNYHVGYFFSINPSTGQPGSLNTSTWCCSWVAYEVVGYTPGATHRDPYYDAYIQFMGTSNSTTTTPKNSTYYARAVRLVAVA